MFIDETPPGIAVIHRRVRIQGDVEQRRAYGQLPENIHIVDDAGPGPIPVTQAVVPAGPGVLTFRQPACIVVQRHLVTLSADIPGNFAFSASRDRQYHQGLCGVASEDYLVEIHLPRRQLQGDPRRMTIHLLYRRAES